MFVNAVGEAMDQDGVKSGVAKDDLQDAAGGGVALEDGVDLFPDGGEHGWSLLSRVRGFGRTVFRWGSLVLGFEELQRFRKALTGSLLADTIDF